MINWNFLRAAGIGAYVMLFASVAWGLVGTTSVFGKRVAKATAVAIHQFVSTVAFLLLVLHLVGVALDRFVEFDVLDLLVPLRSEYRPVAVAFGVVAMYAVVVVLVSSWVRRLLSNRFWRNLHVFAVPAFTLSLLHGLFTGTDTRRPWMWWIYAATGCIVLFLILIRGFTAGVRPTRPAPSPRNELVVAPAAAKAVTARPAGRATGQRGDSVEETGHSLSPALGDAFVLSPSRRRSGRSS